MRSELRTKVFIDTNVLIDVLLEGRPSTDASKYIFQAVKDYTLEGVITVQSLIDAQYVLRKNKTVSLADFYRIIMQFSNYFNIEGLNFFDVRDACAHPSGDFEDDVQFARAKDGFCDYFITGDRALIGRRQNSLRPKILTPEEFIDLMQSE